MMISNTSMQRGGVKRPMKRPGPTRPIIGDPGKPSGITRPVIDKTPGHSTGHNTPRPPMRDDQRPSNRPSRPSRRPQQKPLPSRTTGAFSDMGEAFDYHKNSSYGFVRDPQSPTGWSYVNQFGQVANARKPMSRRERDLVISKQRMLQMNPYFFDEGRKKPEATFTAPWLEGFTGGGGWQPMTGGGWFNTRNWSSWKPGDAIPSNPMTSMQDQLRGPAGDDFYAQLLRAFGVGA